MMEDQFKKREEANERRYSDNVQRAMDEAIAKKQATDGPDARLSRAEMDEIIRSGGKPAQS